MFELQIKQTHCCLWLIYSTRGVNDCNELETGKRHECTNMGKLRKTRIMMASVRDVTSGVGLMKFQVA